MDPRHLHDYIIVPVLDKLNMLTLSASRLLLGTAMVESACGKWVRQLSDGPALGIYQMEPATHDDIWRNYLRYREDLARDVEIFSVRWPHGAAQMVGNNFYATAMARIHYRRRPEPLPAPDNAMGLAKYHKHFYNTYLGATKPEKSVDIFEEVIKLTPVKD